MEEDMKKDGVYSDQAMKIVKDQVAAVPADQQESFCKAAIESINNSANDNGGSDEKEEGEEAKG